MVQILTRRYEIHIKFMNYYSYELKALNPVTYNICMMTYENEFRPTVSSIDKTIIPIMMPFFI